MDEANPHKEGGAEYEYNLVTHYKEGMSKPLGQVVERINLLGHTLAYARQEFEALSRFNSFDLDQFNFDQLAQALATVDVNEVSADYGEGEDSESSSAATCSIGWAWSRSSMIPITSSSMPPKAWKT